MGVLDRGTDVYSGNKNTQEWIGISLSSRKGTVDIPPLKRFLPPEVLQPLSVVLLFLFLSSLYSLAVPIWEAPDEPSHYIRVRRLAEPDFSPPRYPGPFRTVWSEFYLYSSYQDGQPPLYYLTAAAGILLFGVIKNNLLVPQSQGRFLFPALGAAAVLFSAGFCRLFPARKRTGAVWVLVGALAAMNLAAFFQFTRGLT